MIAQKPARLIIDEPASGSWNMAVDAAILESVEPDDAPTLRFYRWSHPTLSLGYFQPSIDRSHHLASREIELVRRTTGGGAIVHDHELTYSVTLPQSSRSHGADLELYHSVHDAVIQALSSIGITATRFGTRAPFLSSSDELGVEPFLCFQRRTAEDLVVGGYKVLGSAQRRGSHGILQHGSLLLASSPMAPELPGLLNLGENEIRKMHSWLLAEKLIDLSATLIQRMTEALSQRWSVAWNAGCLSQKEHESALVIEGNRFTSPSWNFKR